MFSRAQRKKVKMAAVGSASIKETQNPEKINWIHYMEIDRALSYIEAIVNQVSKLAAPSPKFKDRSAALGDFKKWIIGYRDFSSRITACQRNNRMVKIGMYGNEGLINPEEKDSIRESDISKAYLFVDAICNSLFHSRAPIINDYQPPSLLKDNSEIYIPGINQAKDHYAILKMKLVERKSVPASIDYRKMTDSKLMTTSCAGMPDLIIATSLEEGKFYISQIPIGFVWRTIHEMHKEGIYPIAEARRAAQILNMSFLNIYYSAINFSNQFKDAGLIGQTILKRNFLFTPQYTMEAVVEEDDFGEPIIGEGPPKMEEKITSYNVVMYKSDNPVQEGQIVKTVYDIIADEKERLSLYLNDIYNEFERETGLSSMMPGLNPEIQNLLMGLVRQNGMNPNAPGGMDSIVQVLQNALSGITGGGQTKA